jgi:hypothetical protein
MDPHVPHAPIRSIREFLTHIGIVTIGILIALGLEQAVEAHHRAERAQEARDGFRRELADNRSQVEDVLQAMPGVRKDIALEIAKLTAQSSDQDAAKLRLPGLHFDLTSSASWEAAVATQALADLPYDDVHRYAEAFAVYRLFQDEERGALTAWQDLRAFGDDLTKLTPDQRRLLIERLQRYESNTYALDLVGKSAIESGDRALDPH